MAGGKSKGKKTGSMSRHQKVLIAIAIAFLLYSITGFMIVPVLLKNILGKKLAENLHRRVSIETIQVNPYLFKVTVKNFKVETLQGDGLFVGFENLFFDLETASIFKRALVIKSIALTGPSINIARLKDLSYNFSDLLVSPDGREKQDAKPFLFSINNIEIKNGSIVFDDQPKDTVHRVVDLNIAVPYLSNIQHEVEINVKPAFSAIVNGTPVNLSGQTIPFHESRRTVFNIQAQSLDIPEYLAYLPSLGDLTLKSGQLDIKSVLGFEMKPGNIPAMILNGDFSVKEIDVAQKEGESFLTIPRLDVKLLDSKPLELDFHLANITVNEPGFLLRRQKDGGILPLALLPRNAKTPSTEPDTAGAADLKLTVDEIVLESGSVQFDDLTNSQPFSTTLNPVEIKVTGLSTLKDAEGTYDVSLQTEAAENITLQGELGLNPLATQVHIAMQNLQIPRFSPYYADIITPHIMDGRLDLAADLLFSKPQGPEIINVENIGVQLTSITINDKNDHKLFALPSLAISGSSLDMQDHRVIVGNFSGNDGELHLARRQDGTVNLSELFKQPGSPEDKPGEAAPGSSPEWAATLQSAELKGFSIIFQDDTPQESTTILLDKIRLAAKGLSMAGKGSGAIDLGLRIDKKAEVSVKGPISINPLSASLALNLANLPVRTLQPYFADRINLVISDGAISSDGLLKIAEDGSKEIAANFQGNAGIAGFTSFDPVAGEEFLKWKELNLAGIKFDSEKGTLGISDINWVDFYDKIVVFEDGALNLKAVLKSSGEPETAIDDKEKTIPAGEEGEGFLVEIGTVTLQNGRTDFSDRNIKPHYATSLAAISGTISGLSSEAGVTGDVDISGKLDGQAPLSITGRVNPLSEEIFADLVIDFKNIELSPTSPYTGKFIGYTVSKGKLSLDLKYMIESSRISGKNNVFLDQFTLGETVESPDALNLPINLAISLLKNRRGEITLNVPVKGDLADPEFSIGGIVFKAIINLIAKAATSPFALLGALIPEGEDLQNVDFTPGSSQVGEEFTGKLDTIAKVLYDRPGLKMDIMGGFSAEEERKVLHEMQFARLLKNEKFKELTKKKDMTVSLEEITIEPDEFEDYLKEAYKEATFEKPKNILGFAKRLPPEEMEKLLRDNIIITDDDLRLLAIARANAVKSYLVDTGGIEPERLFIIEPQTGEGAIKAPQVIMTIK